MKIGSNYTLSIVPDATFLYSSLFTPADDIMRRVSEGEVKTLADHLPNVDAGCLILGNGPKNLQELWDDAGKSDPQRRRHWIF